MEHSLAHPAPPPAKNQSGALVAAKWLILIETLTAVLFTIFQDNIHQYFASTSSSTEYGLIVTLLGWFQTLSLCAAMILLWRASGKLLPSAIFFIAGYLWTIPSGILQEVLFGIPSPENARFITMIPMFLLFALGLSLLWLRTENLRSTVTALLTILILRFGTWYIAMAMPTVSLTLNPMANPEDAEVFGLCDFLTRQLYSTQPIPKLFYLIVNIASCYLWWKLCTWMVPSDDLNDTPVAKVFTSRAFISAVVLMAVLFGFCRILANIFVAPNFPQLY